MSLRQILVHQCLHPLTGDDVRTVLLAGMQFHAHTSADMPTDLLVGFDEPLGREVTSEIHHRLITRTLVVRYIFITIHTRNLCVGNIR